MTVSAAWLVKDPPLDRLALLVEYLRPVVSQHVFVVDDRTAVETIDTMSTWPDVTLVPFGWVDDFSQARNAALPHCTGDWVLIVDPDELPSLGMLDFIRLVDSVKQEDVTWQGGTYYAPRGYLFFTKNFYSGVQGPEWEEHWHCRLFKRGSGAFYKPVHELVSLDGHPEGATRQTPYMPKAPLSAYLIHSNNDGTDKGATYSAIEAKA
jgi:hypothetical protein